MYVDLTHTSSFTSSDEHHAHTHREVQAAPSRSDRRDHTATNLARRHEPLTKSPAHHLERLVKENTMDSGIMARLEVEDPLLACHDRTAGGSTGCGLSLGGERVLTRG